MGLFFDDKPKESLPVQQQRPTHTFWTFIGEAIAQMFVKLLEFALAILTWILKPLLTWLFEFNGVSRQLGTIKVLLIAVTFGGPLTIVYKTFPSIGDFIFLSRTHTSNTGEHLGHLVFPEREYFVPKGKSTLIQGEHFLFVTYSGYNESPQSMRLGSCHLVPRGEGVVLASFSPPEQAEGFSDEVEYRIKENLIETVPWRRHLFYLRHPSYIQKSNDELREILIYYEKEGSWREFKDDWEKIKAYTDGAKAFEVRAKFTEHAIICF